MAQQGRRRGTQLQRQAQDLKQGIKKVMRTFGRSCRGQSRVFVKRVRQTEHQLLEVGEPLKPFAQNAQKHLEQVTTLSDTKRQRLSLQLTTAMSHHNAIRHQSTRLTQGKKLNHFKLVSAYAPTIAPIMKGQSHCPAQFGRKPGIASEPASGFIFANLVPTGNPIDFSSGLPLLDKVQDATQRLGIGPTPQIHSVAGDLGLNAPFVRQALHGRGILTVGIPTTIEPIQTSP